MLIVLGGLLPLVHGQSTPSVAVEMVSPSPAVAAAAPSSTLPDATDPDPVASTTVKEAKEQPPQSSIAPEPATSTAPEVSQSVVAMAQKPTTTPSPTSHAATSSISPLLTLSIFAFASLLLSIC